jgi:hypothetical protein
MMGKATRKKVVLYFSYFPNYATRRDTVIAQRLADAAGVDLMVFSHRDSPGLDRRAPQIERRNREFALASGASGSLRDPNFRLDRFVPRDMVVMRGHQTDLLRAVYVSFSDRSKWKNLGRHVRKLWIVPANEFSPRVLEQFEPYYRTWLQGLPPAAADKQLDFMFLEIYYSATLGVTFPALADHFFMSPFNSRRLIGLSLGFSDEFRIQGGPVFDLIHRTAPELEAIPFDDETGPDLVELEDRKAVAPAMKKRLAATRARAKLRRIA